MDGRLSCTHPWQGGATQRTGRPLAVAAALLACCWVQAADTPSIPHFVEETDSAGLQSRFEGEFEFQVGGGVATFDCDGDGLPEVYVTAGVNKAKFYRNRSTRGGPIKLQEERSGLELTGANGAYPLDVDGDGQIDLVVLRVGEVQVFRGLGGCKFERANDKWALQTSNAWHTAFSATWERGQQWPTLAFGTYVDRGKPDFPWGSCTPGSLLRPAPGGKAFAAPTELAPGHCAPRIVLQTIINTFTIICSRNDRCSSNSNNNTKAYRSRQTNNLLTSHLNVIARISASMRRITKSHVT